MPWKIDTYLDPHQRLEKPVVGRVWEPRNHSGKRATPRGRCSETGITSINQVALGESNNRTSRGKTLPMSEQLMGLSTDNEAYSKIPLCVSVAPRTRVHTGITRNPRLQKRKRNANTHNYLPDTTVLFNKARIYVLKL